MSGRLITHRSSTGKGLSRSLTHLTIAIAKTSIDTYFLRDAVGLNSPEKKGFEPVPYIGSGRATHGAHNLHLTEEGVKAALERPQRQGETEELVFGYHKDGEPSVGNQMKGRYIKMNLSDVRCLRQTLVAMTTDYWDEQRWKAMATVQEFCGYGLKAVQVALDRLLSIIRDKKFKQIYRLFLKNRQFFDFLRGAKVAAFNPEFESCEWFSITGPGGDRSSKMALDGMKQHVFDGTKTSFNRMRSTKLGAFRTVSNPIYSVDPAPTSKRVLLEQLEGCLPFYAGDDPDKEFRQVWRRELRKWISDVDGKLMACQIRSSKKGDPQVLESMRETQADVQLTDPKFEEWRYEKYRPIKFINNFNQLNLVFWENLCIYVKNNAPFHIATDPGLHVEQALRLEDSTMSAIYAWSATLDVLTNPGQFDKFLATRGSSVAKQLKSVFRIFADFILDSVATALREKPVVIPFLIDHMPNPANANLDLLKTVIRAPKWLESREYFHNVKGNSDFFEFDAQGNAIDTKGSRQNQAEFAARIREAGELLAQDN